MMEFSPNGFDFIVRGKAAVHNGKPHWRDCVNIILDRRGAISILSQIANWLNTTSEKDNELILGPCGWLEKVEDGEWPFADPGVE